MCCLFCSKSDKKTSHSLLLPRRLVLGPALSDLPLLGVAGRHARRHGPLHPLVATPSLRCRLLDDDVVGDEKEGEHENTDHDYVPDFHKNSLPLEYKRSTQDPSIRMLKPNSMRLI